MKQYKIDIVAGAHGMENIPLGAEPQPVSPAMALQGTNETFQAFIAPDNQGSPVILVVFQGLVKQERYSVPLISIVDSIAGLHRWREAEAAKVAEAKGEELLKQAENVLSRPQEPPQPGNVIQMPGTNGIARPEAPKEPGE